MACGYGRTVTVAPAASRRRGRAARPSCWRRRSARCPAGRPARASRRWRPRSTEALARRRAPARAGRHRHRQVAGLPGAGADRRRPGGGLDRHARAAVPARRPRPAPAGRRGRAAARPAAHVRRAQGPPPLPLPGPAGGLAPRRSRTTRCSTPRVRPRRRSKWLGEAGRLGKQIQRLRDWAMETDDRRPRRARPGRRRPGVAAGLHAGPGVRRRASAARSARSASPRRPGPAPARPTSWSPTTACSPSTCSPAGTSCRRTSCWSSTRRTSWPTGSPRRAQAELTAGAGRPGRPAGPAADRPRDCRDAASRPATRSPSGWPRRRPGRITAGLPAPLREALHAARRGDPARRSSAIGDIKADDPDPVRKQQAKAVLAELSKTAQRLLEEADHDVAWVEKPTTGGRRGRSWSRRCRSPARSPPTSTTSAPSSPPRRRWRWAAGSTRWPGRSGLPVPGRAAEAADDAGTARPAVDSSLDVGSPFDYARQGILYVAAHLPRPGRVRAARRRPARSCSTLVEALGGRTLGLFSSRRAAQQAAELVRAAHRPAGAAAGRGGAAAAGAAVPGGPGELPVRRHVAVAGRRRARRRLPARRHRPAAVPPPRRAAGRGPRPRRSTPPAAPASPRSACRSPRSGWRRASAG